MLKPHMIDLPKATYSGHVNHGNDKNTPGLFRMRFPFVFFKKFLVLLSNKYSFLFHLRWSDMDCLCLGIHWVAGALRGISGPHRPWLLRCFASIWNVWDPLPMQLFQSWMQDSSNVCNWDEFQNVARQQACDAHEAAGFRETSPISHWLAECVRMLLVTPGNAVSEVPRRCWRCVARVGQGHANGGQESDLVILVVSTVPETDGVL